MAIKNVLVFPAGTEIGLEIHGALRYCREVRLFAAGQVGSSHAPFVFAQYHELPSVFESGWVESLAALCRQLRIDYVFPAYDDVVVALSREAERIPAKIVSSPAAACEITRSKATTYRLLEGLVRVPRIYRSMDDVETYPVFVKPDRGQGSQGAVRVDSAADLKAAVAAIVDPLICEFLPGEEFTVDCISDRDRGLMFCGARMRCRIRNGISVNTRSVELPEARAIAEVIGRTLGLRGAWFFQLRRDAKGELALLEVAPRIAGSMAAHRVTGVNFPWLSILEEDRVPFSVRTNPGDVELDRALVNRYRYQIEYDVLYIDLDDTLILNDGVNVAAVTLIFQCANLGRKVVLLSRHQGDLKATLERHRLTGLFDDIVHLAAGERKSQHVRSKRAIFVDDSFAERMEVADACGIPTFDCSMIEVLTQQAEDKFVSGPAAAAVPALTKESLAEVNGASEPDGMSSESWRNSPGSAPKEEREREVRANVSCCELLPGVRLKQGT